MGKTEMVPAAWLVTGPGTRGAYVNDPAHWAHGYSVVPLYAHVEQHQGEPVALPARNGDHLSDYASGWNACLTAVETLGPLYTRPAPADQQEPVAWQVEVESYKTLTVDNYARALSEQEHFQGRGRTVAIHPLGRIGDPGEVERLLLALSNTQALLDQANIHKEQRGKTIGALNAKLKDLTESKAMVVESEAKLFQGVERLRAELKNSYTVAEHERLVAKGQEINVAYIASLRAQLAERDALLREVEPAYRAPGLVPMATLINKIDAALSASAEPVDPNKPCNHDYRLGECTKCGCISATE